MALVIDLEEDYQHGFQTIQSLRNVQDKLYVISACLNTSAGTVQSLQNSNIGLSSLASYTYQLQGSIESVSCLEKRVKGTLQLVS